jgi:genome maintenance exonuclease 1
MQLIREKDKFKVTDFKRENKYKYAEYTRDDEHGPRTYAVKDKKVPSVTTILSATQPEEKRKSLDAWRARVGYQEAQAITKKAALRGTEMHYVLEQYLNGTGYLNLSEDGGKARMMAHEIITHLEPLKIIYGNEVNLAYRDRWAGSTDVVGVYNDLPTIIDFKQSNKLKREEWVDDYYFQIAAYSLAHQEQHGPIDQGLICICTKDGQYQEFKMDARKLDEYENKWFERIERYEKSLKKGS